MPLNTLTLFDFKHKKGDEIPTKHKGAIRQLHWFGKAPVCALMARYELSDTIIRKILGYPSPNIDVLIERALPSSYRMPKWTRSSYIVPSHGKIAFYNSQSYRRSSS